MSQLQEFIKTLKDVKIPKQENSKVLLPDLGLIILEGEPLNKELLQGLNYDWVDLDQFSDEIFLNKLTKVSSEGKWLVVNCADEPSPEITRILNQISNEGSFTKTSNLNNALEKVAINPETRILFIVKNEVLESFSNPYFLNIFGPVLRLQ